MTKDELHAYAQEQDGCCKVAKPPGEPVRLYPPDQELGYRFDWAYYYTDEPESFDFARFGIS